MCSNWHARPYSLHTGFTRLNSPRGVSGTTWIGLTLIGLTLVGVADIGIGALFAVACRTSRTVANATSATPMRTTVAAWRQAFGVVDIAEGSLVVSGVCPLEGPR